MSVQRLLITGGPQSGKTTIMNWLRDLYGGRILIVPEAATILLSGGFPPPGENPDPIIIGHFQRLIFRTILELEEMHARLAQRDGQKLLVCDRGCWDGEAYLDGDRASFKQIVGVKRRDLRRYDRALFLQSLASYDADAFNARPTEGNEIRMEKTHLTAARIDRLTWRAWKDHPNIQHLGCDLGIDGKIDAVHRVVDEMLAAT